MNSPYFNLSACDVMANTNLRFSRVENPLEKSERRICPGIAHRTLRPLSAAPDGGHGAAPGVSADGRQAAPSEDPPVVAGSGEQQSMDRRTVNIPVAKGVPLLSGEKSLVAPEGEQ